MCGLKAVWCEIPFHLSRKGRIKLSFTQEFGQRSSRCFHSQTYEHQGTGSGVKVCKVRYGIWKHILPLLGIASVIKKTIFIFSFTLIYENWLIYLYIFNIWEHIDSTSNCYRSWVFFPPLIALKTTHTSMWRNGRGSLYWI